MKLAAIIPAAGQGKRLGSRFPKAFVTILGKPLIVHTLKSLKRSFKFHEMIVAAPPGYSEKLKQILVSHELSEVRVTKGGRTRAESVKRAVQIVSKDSDWILIHDAARPFVTKEAVCCLIRQAKRTGAAALGIPVTSTVKRLDAKRRTIIKTEDRDALVLIQTPQVFKKNHLIRQYEKLGSKALLATDEAALFENSKIKLAFVPGDSKNLKITTPEDIDLFKFYIKRK
ncbi:MAG: 2-C-methyl-D-erythritol 4-phosphate cytidylyltransferase [Candidatus Omnitrophica bacterium CG1_02_46_14]|nr:MAG: 2-C-methyl-D-erythritol 4-phosphate cytidylyltransferase [Candidatus Omnitrophica bacterium CG1_02_46_14]